MLTQALGVQGALQETTGRVRRAHLHTSTAPPAMATFRNLAIGLLKNLDTPGT
ncbi:hypothetical protein [Streptomyces anulatus]|uniref:hypothetical protein n=1 Tax=Streptomyces anulatus TaxID=1892 RepID=UPI002E122F56|nr:hypothetical protein OG557_21160 [Streptomyces anulatus]